MGVYCKNRILMISLILAASGVLTCGLALADIFLPRGSVIVVLASIPLLGIVALGGLLIFAWACDLLDRRGGFYGPRPTAGKSQKPWLQIITRDPSSTSPDEHLAAPKIAMPLRPLVDYPVNLRGRMCIQQNRRVAGRQEK